MTSLTHHTHGRVFVAALPRDDRSEWRIALDTDRRGNTVLDIRVYEEFAGPAKVRGPSKHGISIPIDQARDLDNAIIKAVVVAREMGLLGEGRSHGRVPI